MLARHANWFQLPLATRKGPCGFNLSYYNSHGIVNKFFAARLRLTCRTKCKVISDLKNLTAYAFSRCPLYTILLLYTLRLRPPPALERLASHTGHGFISIRTLRSRPPQSIVSIPTAAGYDICEVQFD